MKGGYQIIDISEAGSKPTQHPEILESFINNGNKPVMFITPSGERVFSKVKVESGGAYSATYLDGEDIIKVSVDSGANVTITVVESGGGDDDKNYMPSYAHDVDIKDYVEFNFFTAPKDGYVVIKCGAAVPENTGLLFKLNTGGDGWTVDKVFTFSGADESRVIFVKKGMSFSVSGTTSDIESCKYFPLISVE